MWDYSSNMALFMLIHNVSNHQFVPLFFTSCRITSKVSVLKHIYDESCFIWREFVLISVISFGFNISMSSWLMSGKGCVIYGLILPYILRRSHIDQNTITVVLSSITLTKYKRDNKNPEHNLNCCALIW